MNIDKIFAGEYMKAADIKGLPDFNGTISGFDIAEFPRKDGGVDRKPYISFSNSDQKIALNQTNAKFIAKLIGSPNMTDWVGNTVGFYATITDFGGEAVDCIRVRPELPTAATTTDDIPF